MNLSITIAQTQTDANSRPSMTVLTSQCACQNSANSERSEEVSGSTDCATSPGFITSSEPRPCKPSLASRDPAEQARPGPSNGSGREPNRRLSGSKGTARLRIVRSAADPTFHDNVPPSTIGDGQKIPRNLTKLGHPTMRPGIASVIWVNAGLPSVRGDKFRKQRSRSPRGARRAASLQHRYRGQLGRRGSWLVRLRRSAMN